MGARLLAVRDARGVERAADDLVADARQVLDAAAADEHHGVLLEVVALAGDVAGDLHPVREPHARDLAQRRVRLLRGRRVDARADAAPLGRGDPSLAALAGLQARSRDLLLWGACGPFDQLAGGRHGGGDSRAPSRPRYAEGVVTSDRPILALDVDGVISLFGFEGPSSRSPGRFHLIDGMAHCIPDGIGGPSCGASRRPTRSSGRPAGRTGPTIACRRSSGCPGSFPFLTFDGTRALRDGPLEDRGDRRYAGDRPLAWVDDCLDRAARTGPRRARPRRSSSPPRPPGPHRSPRGGVVRLGPAGYTA